MCHCFVLCVTFQPNVSLSQFGECVIVGKVEIDKHHVLNVTSAKTGNITQNQFYV